MGYFLNKGVKKLVFIAQYFIKYQNTMENSKKKQSAC